MNLIRIAVCSIPMFAAFGGVRQNGEDGVGPR